MILKSLNGESLRAAGFVALECAALHHAAENCTEGEAGKRATEKVKPSFGWKRKPQTKWF